MAAYCSRSRPMVFDCTASDVAPASVDRKSTRLNSSHLVISYAVFCLKKTVEMVEFEPGCDHGVGGFAHPEPAAVLFGLHQSRAHPIVSERHLNESLVCTQVEQSIDAP